MRPQKHATLLQCSQSSSWPVVFKHRHMESRICIYQSTERYSERELMLTVHFLVARLAIPSQHSHSLLRMQYPHKHLPRRALPGSAPFTTLRHHSKPSPARPSPPGPASDRDSPSPKLTAPRPLAHDRAIPSLTNRTHPNHSPPAPFPFPPTLIVHYHADAPKM